MITLIALIAGIAVGAIGMAALRPRKPDHRPGDLPPRRIGLAKFRQRQYPEEAVNNRAPGYDAGALGAVRTEPGQWDRLERLATETDTSS